MSEKLMSSALIMELSTDEQQMISGGRHRRRRCPRSVIVPRCGPYFRSGGFDGRFDGGFDSGFDGRFDGRFKDDF
jgi:hypothetical protein